LAEVAQLLFSVAAIAALVALAWLLGFKTQPRLSEADAVAEAEAALTGFRARDCLIAADARAALLRGADGSRALVVAKGDRWVVRRLAADAAMRAAADGLVIDCRDTGMRAVRFPLDGAPPGWIEAETERA
jgi:hypothetical protein